MSAKWTFAARGAEAVGDCRERQVVGRHQADGAAVEQPADDRLGAVLAVVRVRAAQHLVEEEQQGQRARRRAPRSPATRVISA